MELYRAHRVLQPDPQVVRLIASAAALIETDRELAKQYLTRASALLTVSVSRQMPMSFAKPGAQRGGLAPWQLKRVTEYIDANLASSIQAADLAAVTRLSVSQFFRAFKAATSLTPFTFIARRRIVRACEMMKTTRNSQCQIAIACGFCDQSHFCRVFRQIIGESPSDWREAHADDLGP